jgi:RHS repeat-associated protein
VSRSGTDSRGGTAYLGKDILGSVRSATNDGGSLEDRYEYDAFGKPYKGDLTTGMNLGYTGKPYNSATGLYNYGYRDYKPETVRFTTADPVRDGANWFSFVNNDPVNYVDLWGLENVYTFSLSRTITYSVPSKARNNNDSLWALNKKTVTIVNDYYSLDEQTINEKQGIFMMMAAQNQLGENVFVSDVSDVDSSLLPSSIVDKLGPNNVVETERTYNR